MEPRIFGTDDDPALTDLRREVAKGRTVGRVHIEFRHVLAGADASAESIASAFVKSLALRPPAEWTKLDTSEAAEVATRTLHLDLAYKMPIMTIDLAKGLARRFVECCGKGALFVTNGTLAFTKGEALPHDQRWWSPLTDATFDTGVVGVSASRVGLPWVEDED